MFGQDLGIFRFYGYKINKQYPNIIKMSRDGAWYFSKELKCLFMQINK